MSEYYLSKVVKTVEENKRNEPKNENIWVTLDETTDIVEDQIGNVMIVCVLSYYKQTFI